MGRTARAHRVADSSQRAAQDGLHGDATSPFPVIRPLVSLPPLQDESPSAFGLVAEKRSRREELRHDLSWNDHRGPAPPRTLQEMWWHHMASRKWQQESDNTFIQVKKMKTMTATVPHTGVHWYCHADVPHRNEFKQLNSQHLPLDDLVNSHKMIKWPQGGFGSSSGPCCLLPTIMGPHGAAHLSRATPTGDEKHLQLFYSPSSCIYF
ncbi:uncharacterized protein LOC129191469 [Dunckerocampus dactyliophorus]|uniref:uncharacterized protein LOC129191469 n=1 Tax=Dunckerocampus dactyliophorus TaxID=161453 RepID=UPI002405F681|nr:uncharacterized protein LOC129191469 [Dunckerocampus dactyliophorus]